MATYAQAVAAQSPNRYYKFEGNATDSGSDGSAITYGGNTAYSGSGGTDGSNSVIFGIGPTTGYAKSSAVAWASNAITITAWIYPGSGFGYSGTQVWFESSVAYSGTTGRSFVVYSDATNLQMAMFSGSGSGSVFDSVAFPLPATATYAHCAFIFDASASTTNRMLFYKNATAQTQSSATWQTGTGDFQTNDMYVMSRAGSSLFQDGQMDDLALWKSRLTATQISNQYTSTIPGGASARRASPLSRGLYIR